MRRRRWTLYIRRALWHITRTMSLSDRLRFSLSSRRYYDNEDRPRRIKAQLFSVLTILSGYVYIGWCILNYNPRHPVMGWLLIAAEALCLWIFILAAMGLWRLRFKPAQGLPAGPQPWSIDVLMTTCGEPMAVVGKTMRAIRQIRWTGPLKVYILDDAGAEEVRRLAQELGFTYLSRKLSGVPRENAKAGNLNFGLQNSSGEFLLVLDADQVPKPEILERLGGYLVFKSTAFIQSKQDYLTHDNDPFYNSSTVFYEAVQLGMDNTDTAISAGTGVLYRRKALEDVNGFATWNVVEDLTTSYELHSRGWKSFYFPHALSRGLAPTSIWEVYQQRGQWALDTMRLFFWDNPLFKRGLTLQGRLHYSTVGMSYVFSAIVLPFFYLTPLWTYLTGETIFTQALYQYLGFRLVYFAVMIAAVHYLCLGRAPAKQFRHTAGLFPVYLIGILRAAFYPKGRKKPLYRVNNARTSKSRLGSRPALLAVAPQLTLVAAHAIFPFYSIAMRICPPRVVAGHILLSVFAIWALSYIVAAALSAKRWPEGDDPENVYAPDK